MKLHSSLFVIRAFVLQPALSCTNMKLLKATILTYRFPVVSF